MKIDHSKAVASEVIVADHLRQSIVVGEPMLFLCIEIDGLTTGIFVEEGEDCVH